MTKKKKTVPTSSTPNTDNLLNIFSEHPRIEEINKKISSLDKEIIDKKFETIEKEIDQWNTDQAKQLLDTLVSASPASPIFDAKRQEVEQKISDKKINTFLNQIIELYNQGKYQEAKEKAHKQNKYNVRNVKNAHNAISFLDKIWKKFDFKEGRNRTLSGDEKYINMQCGCNDLSPDSIDRKWLDTSSIEEPNEEQTWIKKLKQYLTDKYIISRKNKEWNRWLEIIDKEWFSPEQETLYQEICSKIDKKLEEEAITNINTTLQKVKMLCKEGKYGEAKSLIATIQPKTTEQQKEHNIYINIIEQNKDKANIQQMRILRKELHENIGTASTESLVKNIETIQKLFENIWDKDVLREYMTFPEKDIFLALREAFLSWDEEKFLKIYGILLLKSDIINQEIYNLKNIIKNSPLKDKKLLLPKKEIDAALGIHRPLFGFGKIKTDEWDDEKMFISKVKETLGNRVDDIRSIMYSISSTWNINYPNNDWETLLSIAAKEPWYIDIIKILLKHPDIDINKKNRNTYTPIIRAIYRYHKDIIELLLQHPDIDVNVVDKDWETPLSWARKKWSTDIEKLLLAHPKIKT